MVFPGLSGPRRLFPAGIHQQQAEKAQASPSIVAGQDSGGWTTHTRDSLAYLNTRPL
jgi:hypothetical protein